MHSRIIMGVAALVLGTACVTAPALAAKKKVKPIVSQSTTSSTSNSAPAGNAPLSPGGISAAASAFGGPGYNGPFGATAGGTTTGDRTSGLYASVGGVGTRATTATYSTLGPKNGAPLSPGGISAAASAFGGPGYQP